MKLQKKTLTSAAVAAVAEMVLSDKLAGNTTVTDIALKLNGGSLPGGQAGVLKVEAVARGGFALAAGAAGYFLGGLKKKDSIGRGLLWAGATSALLGILNFSGVNTSIPGLRK